MIFVFLLNTGLVTPRIIYLMSYVQPLMILFFSLVLITTKLLIIPEKGRPHGGKCWVIRKNLIVKSFENLSEVVSKLEVYASNFETVLIYGLWIPFDDRTPAKFGLLQSTFSLLEAELSNNEDSCVTIIGDFNCDTNRKKRFDLKFKNFILSNKLKDGINFFNQNLKYTYKKGDYVATLDHVVMNEIITTVGVFFGISSDIFL